MTKKTRTILFTICLVFFILAAPALILYSQGYRFDLGNKKIVQTGAFYFKISPKNANIYLDGEFIKKTSSLTGSTMVGDLAPKIYKVEIKKYGYLSWRKYLDIKEKEVTEAKDIILFPQNINFTVAEQKPKITLSATSSDGEKIFEFNDHEISVKFLEDQTDPAQKKKWDKIFLARFSEKIGDIFWLNNRYLIFNAGDKIKIAEIDDRDEINIIDIAEFKNPKIFWDKGEKNLYVSSQGKLYVSDGLFP